MKSVFAPRNLTSSPKVQPSGMAASTGCALCSVKLLLSEDLLRLTKELGIRTLSEQGIAEKDFDMLAEDVLKEPVLGFNPRQGVTKEDIVEILRKAF